MKLELLGTEGLDTSGIEAVVEQLVKFDPEWLPKGDLAVQFVDALTSRKLNQKYAGDDYATDVLTFSYTEEGGPVAGTLADIAVCVPIAEAQAEAAGTSLKDELATLVLHAILHVAGFDHVVKSERDLVDGMQAEILKAAAIEYRDFNWKDA